MFKGLLSVLLLGGFILATLLWAYPESVVIMRGDYEFDQWMFIPVSSKTWLLVAILTVIGGSVGYIFYTIYKKAKRRSSVNSLLQ